MKIHSPVAINPIRIVRGSPFIRQVNSPLGSPVRARIIYKNACAYKPRGFSLSRLPCEPILHLKRSGELRRPSFPHFSRPTRVHIPAASNWMAGSSRFNGAQSNRLEYTQVMESISSFPRTRLALNRLIFANWKCFHSRMREREIVILSWVWWYYILNNILIYL